MCVTRATRAGFGPREPPTRGADMLRRAARSVLLLALAPFVTTVGAQLIPIKTLPITEGDQFRIFPSVNVGMAGASIALPDSLLDPFMNPAKGARSLNGMSRARFSGSPTFYSLSDDAGGGQTLPMAALGRFGQWFGGVAVAYQEIDRIGDQPQPGPISVFTAEGNPITIGATRPSRRNQFAFAMAGREIARHKLTIGASALWSGLNHVDGTELLYAGSQNVLQDGNALDVRFGVMKELPRGQTFEALLLHNRFDMTHDVTWLDPFWDPNNRFVQMRTRIDHNIDQTNTWGLHLNYVRPLAQTGWRLGAISTANLMSHPHLPEYQLAQVSVIPWDPGHSAAYDFGVGIAKTRGPTTLGVDAVYEPIRSHTWGESRAPIETERGVTIPTGGKTTENWFRFSNAIFRAGVGRDLPIDTARSKLHLQAGIALRSINYALRQFDHVTATTRRQRESWTEWTRTWGMSLQLSDLELRYVGLHTTGTGRPGIVPENGRGFAVDAVALSGGRNILSAPSGPLTLTGVSVTTHQFSVSMPLR
jgi:hypothetical protein